MEKAVLDYVSNNNGKVDSVDIVSHFGLRADITLNYLQKSIDKGFVKRRHTFGINYRYFVIVR